MFPKLGRAIFRFRKSVLVLGVVGLAIAGVFAAGTFPRLKGGGFDDPASESSRVGRALAAELGRDEGTLVVLFSSSDGLLVDTPEFQAEATKVLERLQAAPGVGRALAYWSLRLPQFVSEDKTATFALVGLIGDKPTQQKTCAALRPLATSERLSVRLGGYPAVFDEINRQVKEDLKHAELLTFPIVAILLVLIFGSLVAASLPLVVGIATVVGAFFLLRLATHVGDVSIYSINIVTMLGLGLAIDYSLFVVSRFREEMERQGGDVRASLERTLDTAGRTVLFSGITVAISLLSLLVFPVMFLRSMGLGGAAVVAIAMVTSLTLLPALLAALGPRVNALPVRKRKAAPATGEGHGFWYRTSLRVMRHPGLVVTAVAAVLVFLGLPFLRVRFATPDARSLPKGMESRMVAEALQTRFPKNETEPIQILVTCPAEATSVEGLRGIAAIAESLRALPGVRRVDSLAGIGPPAPPEARAAFYASGNPIAATAARLLAKDRVTILNVLYDTPSSSPESQELVRAIRAVGLPEGFSMRVGGNSAALVDFLETLRRHAPVAFAIIVVVIFVLLFLMLGSLVIPLKAVVMNVLSLSVSFGALVWIFQDGNLADFLDFTPLGSIDGTQPVLIFAVAFGLSMDYEVFLLSRVKEQYDRTKDATRAVALGVEKTGSIITSAALLLVVVIGAFTTGKVVFVKQIGVGLGLAVILDATIVRMLLVPASMALMGKYNWWAPKPLLALYHKLGLAEIESGSTMGERRPSWVGERQIPKLVPPKDP